MKFFRDSDEKAYDKARKRLAAVSGSHVQNWAETSLWASQAGLERFRLHHDRAALEEARTGIVGVLAAVDTLLDNNA